MSFWLWMLVAFFVGWAVPIVAFYGWLWIMDRAAGDDDWDD